MRRPWKVVVLKGKSGKWHWHLKSGNGRILAASETYSSFHEASEMANKVWTRFWNEDPNVRYVESYKRGK